MNVTRCGLVMFHERLAKCIYYYGQPVFLCTWHEEQINYLTFFLIARPCGVSVIHMAWTKDEAYSSLVQLSRGWLEIHFLNFQKNCSNHHHYMQNWPTDKFPVSWWEKRTESAAHIFILFVCFMCLMQPASDITKLKSSFLLNDRLWLACRIVKIR